MAKKFYAPVNGLSKEVRQFYVPVNGLSKKVVKAYCPVNGISKLFWDKDNIFKDWAQFDGSTYLPLSDNHITLPFKENADYKITVDFSVETYKSPQSVFGNNSGGQYSHLTQYNNNWHCSDGTGGQPQFSAQLTGRHTFVENSNGYNYFDGTQVSSYTPRTQGDVSIWVGNRESGGGQFNGKIYSFKIESISTGNIICQLKPALVNGSTPALVDTVNEDIYTQRIIMSVGDN